MWSPFSWHDASKGATTVIVSRCRYPPVIRKYSRRPAAVATLDRCQVATRKDGGGGALIRSYSSRTAPWTGSARGMMKMDERLADAVHSVMARGPF